MLRQKDCGAFHRVCTTREEARNGTRHVGEDSDRGEYYWVENPCLVIVSYRSKLEIFGKVGHFSLTNKYTTARENMKRRIKIIWVSPTQKSRKTSVSPPGMRGSISSVGLDGPPAPASPPTTIMLPLDKTSVDGYQRPVCMDNSSSTELRDMRIGEPHVLGVEVHLDFPPNHSCH